MSDPANTVPVVDIAVVVAPALLAVAGVIIRAGLTTLAAEVKRLTGFQIQQSTIDDVDKLAANAAASAVAAAEGNLAGVAIPVGSPIVANAVTRALAAAPAALAKAGITPEAFAAKVQAELGKLQAAMPPTAAGK